MRCRSSAVWYGLPDPYRNTAIKHIKSTSICLIGPDIMRRHHRKTGQLPKNAVPIEVVIDHVGGRGDGVGTATYTHNYETKEHLVFVPATLPTERVIAQPISLSGQGMKARIIELLEESPDRQAPACDAFPACGGCSFQHWHPDNVSKWKQQQVEHFLSRAGVSPGQYRPLHTSPMHSRRRATFHLKRLSGGVAAGFHERQGQRIIDPVACSILHPGLITLLDQLRALAADILPTGATIDARVNLLDQGPCVQLAMAETGKATQGLDKSPDIMAALGSWAAATGLARLSILPSESRTTAIPLFCPAPPTLKFGAISISPPPGAFLQTSTDGEACLQSAVAEIVGDAKSAVDLFAGCGTLSLPLVGTLSALHAVEQDQDALASLKAGVDAAGVGARVTTRCSDLANAPLTVDDLASFEAAIIDPPRNGAAAQTMMLAKSEVQRIAMVSCNPATFARDAATLCDAGFVCDWVQVIDQFRMSNHIEIVAQFTAGTSPRRRSQ